MPGTAAKDGSTGWELSKGAERRAEELSEKLGLASPSGQRESMVFEVISALEEYPDERAALATTIVSSFARRKDCDNLLLNEVASGVQRYFQTILDRDSEIAFVNSFQKIAKTISGTAGGTAVGPGIGIRMELESLAAGEIPALGDEAKLLLDKELKSHSGFMKRLTKEIAELGELEENECPGLTFEQLWNRAFKKLEDENRPLWVLHANTRDDAVYEQTSRVLLANSRKGNRLADIRTEAIASVKNIVFKLRIAMRAEADFAALDQRTRKDILEALRHLILYLKRYDGLDPRDSTFSAETVRNMLDLGDEWGLVVEIRIAFYHNDPEKVNELFMRLLTKPLNPRSETHE